MSMILGFLVALTGCGDLELMPTPNIYIGSDFDPFADVPPSLQGNTVDILYVTDRQPVRDEERRLGYDHNRSYSMAFGSAIVQVGDEETTWEEIVAASRSRRRSSSLGLRIRAVIEKGRFPATPYPVVMGPDLTPIPNPEVVADHDAVAAKLVEDLNARLAKTPDKEVFVYVHGYNNAFNYSASVMAEIWHFLGRRGVPLVYTWPAGQGGLRGYFYDRESGEFTIYHLKQLLRILRDCEEVEKVHIIAHSRGTDIIVTALREMFIEYKGAIRPRGKRKLKNLILAAPDMDIDVISQRIIAEELMEHFERITMYVSTTDAALGLSTWFFLSQGRIGRITSIEDLPETLKVRAQSRSWKEVTAQTYLIDARVKTGFIGHSYFYLHPAVSSDLVMMLRYDLDPGSGGRPLESLGSIFWRLDNDYPPPGSYRPKENE
jgi:esterase/lipase superfamily enzyme